MRAQDRRPLSLSKWRLKTNGDPPLPKAGRDASGHFGARVVRGRSCAGRRFVDAIVGTLGTVPFAAFLTLSADISDAGRRQ
jgi:hypothetical protein